jgi:hypothetical protein
MSEPVEHRYSDGVVAEIRSPQAAPAVAGYHNRRSSYTLRENLKQGRRSLTL